jgi:septal ring factor EnvC (AmiA/AmiB activator)
MPSKKEAPEKAEALLGTAIDCLDLAKSQQDLADKTHEIAAGQRKNADQQHELAAKQDRNANRLDANAKKLAALGHALETNKAETNGDPE